MKLAIPIMLSYKMKASAIQSKLRDVPVSELAVEKRRLWEEQHAVAAPMIASMYTELGGLHNKAAQDVATSAACLRTYDLCTLREEEVGFLSEEFQLRATSAPVEVHTLVLWFDVEFSERFCAEEAVTLSNSPHAAPTHWAQTVLHLREPVALGETDALRGVVSVSRRDGRGIDVTVRVRAHGADGRPAGAEQTLVYEI